MKDRDELQSDVEAGDCRRFSLTGSCRDNAPNFGLLQQNPWLFLDDCLSHHRIDSPAPKCIQETMSSNFRLFNHLRNVEASSKSSENRHCYADRILAPGCHRPSTISELPTAPGGCTAYLLSKFHSLHFGNGDFDPVFGLAFLYDVHTHSRISEVFEFNTNSSRLMNLFNGGKNLHQSECIEWPTKITSCLFRSSRKRSVSPSTEEACVGFLKSPRANMASSDSDNSEDGHENSQNMAQKDVLEKYLESQLRHCLSKSDHVSTKPMKKDCCDGGIFLVVRVEKVLQQSDNIEMLEHRMKVSKKCEKSDAHVSNVCQRLGQYRMPLAWTAVDLAPLLLQIRESDVSECGTRAAFDSMSRQSSHTANSRLKRSSSADSKIAHHDSRNRKAVHIPDSNFLKRPIHTLSPLVDTRRHSDLGEIPEHRNIGSPLNVTLSIDTFYKQESDRFNDEELGRSLSEMHRQTLSNFVLTRFNRSDSSTPHTPDSSDRNSRSNLSQGDLNTHSRLHTALHPNSVLLKRSKQYPHLHLLLELTMVDSKNLLELLKSTVQPISRRGVNSAAVPQWAPLISPDLAIYTSTLFTQPKAIEDESKQPLAGAHEQASLVTPEEVPEGSVIREVLELPIPDLMQPNTSFRHLLYIRPRSVSFSGSRQSFRNISIHVQLLCTSGSVTKVIPAIYGKSSSSAFVRGIYTSVFYHNRSPEFCDEIKMQLPQKLDDNYYILFTFVHITCRMKKVDSTNNLESIIGYSWLPLMREGRLENIDATLLVSVVKPTAALAKMLPDLKEITEKFNMEAFKPLEAGRELFHVTSTVVSTVLTQDPSLNQLLVDCEAPNVHNTLKSLVHRDVLLKYNCTVCSPQLSLLVAFVAPLFDGLLRLVLSGCAASHRDERMGGFVSLFLLGQLTTHLSTALPDWNDQFKRNHLLVAYLAGPVANSEELVFWSYFCGAPLFGLPTPASLLQHTMVEGTSVCFPEEILRMFVLSGNEMSQRFQFIPLQTWWLIFELVIRLMVEHAMRCSDFPKSSSDPSCMYSASSPLSGVLTAFLHQLTDHVVSTACTLSSNPSLRSMNKMLAFLFYDLLSLFPITFVLSEIGIYCKAIDSQIAHLVAESWEPSTTTHVEQLVALKLEFLAIISKHPNYLSLSAYKVSDCRLSEAIPFAAVDVIRMRLSDLSVGLERTLAAYPSNPNLDGLSENPLVLLILQTLETGCHLDSTILHQLAGDILCSLIMFHEAAHSIQERETTELVISPPTSSPTFKCSLSTSAHLYHGLLDIVNGLSAKIVRSWQVKDTLYGPAVTRRLTAATNFHSYLDEHEGVDPPFREPRLVKWHQRHRKSVTMMSRPFLPKSASDQHLSHDEALELAMNLGSEAIPSSSHVFHIPTLQKLLLSTLWVIRHIDQNTLSIWLSRIGAEARHRLIVLLCITLNVFRLKNMPHEVNQLPDPKKPSMVKAQSRSNTPNSKSNQSSPNDQTVGSKPTLARKLTIKAHESDIVETALRWLPGQVISLVVAVFERIIWVSPLCVSQYSCIDHILHSNRHMHNILISLFQTLCDSDNLQGQPGLSLFVSLSSPTSRELDRLVPYAQIARGKTGRRCQLLETGLRVLLCAFSLDYARSVEQCCLLRSFTRIGNAFPNFLFVENPGIFVAYIYNVLALCVVNDSALRSEAVNSLYHLFRNYFLLTKNLDLLKTDLYTCILLLFIPLSQFANGEHHLPDMLTNPIVDAVLQLPLNQRHDRLRDALRNLRVIINKDMQLSKSTSELKSSDSSNSVGDRPFSQMQPQLREDTAELELGLSAQLDGLIDELKILLFNAAQLQTFATISMQVSPNPEHCVYFVDLLHKLAHLCRFSPELRVFWLIQMTKVHEQFKQLAEAAQCLTHSISLIAEHRINRNSYKEDPHIEIAMVDCATLSEAVCNSDVLEECCSCGTVIDGVVSRASCAAPAFSPDLQATYRLMDTSKYFSLDGWCSLVMRTGDAFMQAGLYELVPRVYGKLVPPLEVIHHYAQLVAVHGRIRDSYMALQQIQESKRFFSAYFRVGFYGHLFGALNGTVFVYRAPPLTKIVDITEQLSNFYNERYGANGVVIIQHSNTVNMETLDSSKVYLQILYVEPYFEEFQLRERKTEMDRNYAVNRFTYSVPFTLRGQPHGSLGEQFQRCIILTTERCLPYLNVRVRVVSTESEIRSPIEVSHNDIERRVLQLEKVLNAKPVDIKFLQMLLQGCIGTTVNQGPVEVALAFLRPEQHISDPTNLPESSCIQTVEAFMDAQNNLRACFQRMLTSSQRALSLNRKLIGSDQYEYQDELERRFAKVQADLTPLLVPSQLAKSNDEPSD